MAEHAELCVYPLGPCDCGYDEYTEALASEIRIQARRLATNAQWAHVTTRGESCEPTLLNNRELDEINAFLDAYNITLTRCWITPAPKNRGEIE